MENKIEGYKFFIEGFKSKFRNMQYEVEKTYSYDGEIKLCKSGFHFSKELKDAFLYYSDAKHCCKVIGSGEIIEGKDKVVCSEIYIKEELDFNNILKKMSEDENCNVKANVVLNKNCPIKILKKMSEDKDSYVKSSIARNENCPEDIFRKLSKDKDWRVRANVALNKNCPENILRKLSDDEDWGVRKYVAENKNCPLDILNKIYDNKKTSMLNIVFQKIKMLLKKLF